MKQCTGCKQILELNLFNLKNNGKPYAECKSCRATRKRKWHHLNKDSVGFKEKQRIANAKRYAESRLDPAFVESRKQYQFERRQQLKAAAMNYYSNGKCSKCGISDLDVLTIDHINNDGGDLRRQGHDLTKDIYVKLMREGYPSGYDVLCFNCNVKKHLENIRGIS